MARDGAEAQRAILYTVGLDGVRTVCARWAGPFADTGDTLEQVEERALRQANLLGGVHTFLLELRTLDDVVLGTEFFRVGAENFGNTERSLLSEPANDGGRMAQMMRHNEALMKGATLSFRETTAALLRDRELTGRRAEFLEEKYMKALEVVSSVVMHQHEHEIGLIKAKGNAAAKEKVVEKVAGLIPEVLASFVSGKTGQAANGAAIAAKGLFSSISGEQMQAILGALDDGQRLQLIGLMKRLAAENEGVESPPNKANGDARATH